MAEVERLLVEWGKWCWYGAGSSYQRVSSGGGFAPDISDDDALRVDRALAQLRQADELTGQLLIDHYRRELGYRFLADKYRISYGKVVTLIGHGKGFVLGALTNISEAA